MILSGSPHSVLDEGSPRAPQVVFDFRPADPRHLLRPADHGQQLGGEVEGGHAREFGRADVEILEDRRCSRRLGGRQTQRCG